MGNTQHCNLTGADLHVNKVHGIVSSDHTSDAISDKMLKANANGLPVDATNTDTEVADAVTKKHTQGTDTALGVQSQDLNMGTHKITAVTDPVSAQDAATKAYVDANAFFAVNAILGTL